MTRIVPLRALAPKHVEIYGTVIDLEVSDNVTIPHVVFVAERDGNEVDSIPIPVGNRLRMISLERGVTQWGTELRVSPNEEILVAVEVGDDYEGYSIICDGTAIPAGTTVRLERNEGTG